MKPLDNTVKYDKNNRETFEQIKEMNRKIYENSLQTPQWVKTYNDNIRQIINACKS